MTKLQQMQERAIEWHNNVWGKEVIETKKELKDLITEVWNEAIKECEWCVPEEVPSMPLLHLDSKEGYKLCREQTLQAIRQKYE